MSLRGDVDALAARLGTEFNAVRAEMPPGGVGGVVDCSAMTTAAQINTASAAAGSGATIWLGQRGTDPLTIEDTIVLRPNQRIAGAGGRTQLTRVVAGPSFPAGKPLIAALGYLNNGGSADNPASVTGVNLNASSKAGSSGLVVYNFWSHFEDIQVHNIAGPDAAGILVTDRGVDGVTITDNSHSENTFVRCRFFDHGDRAIGFKVETHRNPDRDPPDGANQDGHILDSFFAGISGDAIRIDRAAGWSIENNHLYGIGYNGIVLGSCYATKVLRNYVEDFGGADGENNSGGPTYGYFNGIAMETVLDTRASIMAENTVSTAQPSSPAGNRWTCFFVRAGWGQNRANLVMVGNTAVWATGAPATSRSWAYRIGEGEDPAPTETPARMLYVEWAANQAEELPWWAGVRYVENDTVTITEAGGDVDLSGYVPTTDPRLSDARTPTAHTHPATAVTAAPRTVTYGALSSLSPASGVAVDVVAATLTGNPTITPAAGSDGQVVRLRLLAGTSTRTVTVGSSVRLTTGITDRTLSVPSGQVGVLGLEFLAGLGAGGAWALFAKYATS